MTRPRSVALDDAVSADLWVGTRYEGGSTLAEEPLDRILHCGNMGGFRIRGSIQKDEVLLVALYTTFHDEDWPDRIERESARFVYYGDNKSPGRALHETPKHGNELLRRVFDAVHLPDRSRTLVPPFFVFSSVSPGRSVRFHGLAAPGARDVPETEDLIAIWKTKDASRFQNYRAVFTLLDVDPIPRTWLEELLEGTRLGPACPGPWRRWVERGVYERLPEETESWRE